MSSYGRRLIIGLVVGPMIILGLFAWSAASAPVASDRDQPTAAGADAPTDSLSSRAVPTNAEVGSDPGADPESAADDGVDPGGSAATSDGDRIRELPRAQGLPEPPSDVVAPVAVRIDDIRVTGDVVPVGVEADGAFEVPSVRQVGWYRFGSNAGEAGSTVLAAHISFNGVDGVFRHLEAVSLGAEVAVDMADGSEVRYRIVDLVEYDKADLPVDGLFSESGADRLVLITCGGTFNPRLRTYDSNVVAYAEPVTG